MRADEGKSEFDELAGLVSVMNVFQDSPIAFSSRNQCKIAGMRVIEKGSVEFLMNWLA
jgi:hypothetical protein